MSQHLETGRRGEEIAAAYLEKQGFRLLEKNWRMGQLEVDIIGSRNNILHFIEVKTRRSTLYGYPEQSVNRVKFRHLQTAASAYLRSHPQWKRIQFDILSILLLPNCEPEFLLLSDIYF